MRIARANPVRAAAAALAAAAVAGVASGAAGQSFQLIGTPPGSQSSFAEGMSRDGTAVCGLSLGDASPVRSFVWTSSGGLNDFGLGSGIPIENRATGVSDGGVVVAGWSVGTGQGARAYRWSGAGTYQDLGVQSAYQDSFANGVSGDGSVVVGLSSTTFQGGSTAGQAFRWTQAGGLQPLGFLGGSGSLSNALAVSRDGGTIVGYSGNDAAVWRAGAGWTALPNLPGPTIGLHGAFGVNDTGSIIVGLSGQTDSWIMWQDGVAINLGRPSWSRGGNALSVSNDGSVVVGNNGAVGVPGGQLASVWTQPTGIIPLAQHLAAHGVSVPGGYVLSTCAAISSDGTVFSGYAREIATGRASAYIASIPTPGAYVVLTLALPLSIRRRRRALPCLLGSQSRT